MVLADDLRDNRGPVKISPREGKKWIPYIIPLICIGVSELPISPLATGWSRFRFDSEEATREPEIVSFGFSKSSIQITMPTSCGHYMSAARCWARCRWCFYGYWSVDLSQLSPDLRKLSFIEPCRLLQQECQ